MSKYRERGPKPYPFLIRGLLNPQAYPHPADDIQVRETHISWVVLAGEYAYKIKKPIDVGFLDFSTLERRSAACEEEVQLNRRLAPSVYLGVVDVVTCEGTVHIGGPGHILDRAVHMRRLPEDGMLTVLLARSGATPVLLRRLARLVARFHGQAATGSGVDSFGSPAAIARNWRENLAQLRPFVGRTLPNWEGDALATWGEQQLAQHGRLFARRQEQGHIRDGHGDLHSGSICVVGRKIIPFDCLEFSPRYRCGDVASEVAFMAMDLDHVGRPDLALHFVFEYVRVSRDRELLGLLPFYEVYRAIVRGKVLSLRLLQPGLDSSEEARLTAAARSYFDLAFTYAHAVLRRQLVVVAGLPGSGKSTLAQELSRRWGMLYASTDVVRKRLEGLKPTERAQAAFGTGLYAADMSRRTYHALRRQAGIWLRRGVPVLLDGTFGDRHERELAHDLAQRAQAGFRLILVEHPEAVRRRRILARETDPERTSDATWEIARQLQAGFSYPEELSPLELLVDPTGGASADPIIEQLSAQVVDQNSGL